MSLLSGQLLFFDSTQKTPGRETHVIDALETQTPTCFLEESC